VCGTVSETFDFLQQAQPSLCVVLDEYNSAVVVPVQTSQTLCATEVVQTRNKPKWMNMRYLLIQLKFQ